MPDSDTGLPDCHRDVFISHSKKDSVVAQSVCFALESNGIKCWIAPRNINAGENYVESIMNAMDNCRAVVLIMSISANESDHVFNEIEKAATERVENFDVRTPSIHVPVSNLSGGNQQKVIVAREFSRPIKLLIASQPTRGLDVGSIEYIHGQIVKKRNDGTAVLLVSPELDEIMSLADRIAVMFKGKFIAVLPAEEATREKLGLLMAGIQESVPA